MGLKKAENQVKILLADTIMALCRNTLNQHAEISVEGLLGITLDNDEIFLVSLNQTIKNPNVAAKKRSIEQDNDVDRKDSKKSRKDSDNDQDSDSESEKKPRRRKRHKKRRSRSSAGESESSSEGEGSDTTIEENSYNAAANSTDLTDVTNSQNVVRIKREQDEDEDEDLVIVKEELSENIPSSSAFPFMAQSFQSIPQLHGSSLNNFQPNSSMNESIASHNQPMHISPHPQPGTSVSQSGRRRTSPRPCISSSWWNPNYNATNSPKLSPKGHSTNCRSITSTIPNPIAPEISAILNAGQFTPQNSGQQFTSQGSGQITPQSSGQLNSGLADNANIGHSLNASALGDLELVEFHPDVEQQRSSQPHCQLCGKKFLYWWMVKRHMSTHMGGVKDYQCELCGKYLSSKQNLIKHRRSAHQI